MRNVTSSYLIPKAIVTYKSLYLWRHSSREEKTTFSQEIFWSDWLLDFNDLFVILSTPHFSSCLILNDFDLWLFCHFLRIFLQIFCFQAVTFVYSTFFEFFVWIIHFFYPSKFWRLNFLKLLLISRRRIHSLLSCLSNLNVPIFISVQNHWMYGKDTTYFAVWNGSRGSEEENPSLASACVALKNRLNLQMLVFGWNGRILWQLDRPTS